MVSGQVIEAEDVDASLHSRPAGQGGSPVRSVLAGKSYDSLRDARNAFERDYIARKLREHGWNVSKTAEDLKVERSHLHRKIKLLNVELRPES